MNKTKSIYIPEELIKRLDEYCKKRMIVKNQFIERAIEKALDEAEKE